MSVIIVDWKKRFSPNALMCGCAKGELVLVKCADGTKQFRLRCIGSHAGKVGTQNLPYKALIETEKLQCREIRQNTPTPDGTCERCGKTGPVQGHHVAPREYFADANDWPQIDLCQDCHREWHQTIQRAVNANFKTAS